ncbi:hypothetical protein Cpir12675_001102 [Ceratocystis pirilliformis]|uniref:Senescence domain-containing protein n=1 Tax=Ceratocystis pirilliformis TaxID=259994 RepID=A0ABR3ZIF7_9PEZI
MAISRNDPKLLYAISGVKAYHVANGKEECLTRTGPQTLSLLMVPTAPPYDSRSGLKSQEEDFYLHLHLPPKLDLPLPATTQIYHQPPTSYLIPRWDLGPSSGAFTRIEFPSPGSRKDLQEDVDTFETILAQCTAFLERVPPPKPDATGPWRTEKEKEAFGDAQDSNFASTSARPKSHETLPAYNPAEFAPGQAYVPGSHSAGPSGRIVLINEEDGSVVGEIGEGYVVEDSKINHGSKEPVEISFPAKGGHSISVAPTTLDYCERDFHPAYNKSSIVGGAKMASRLVVTTSDFLTQTMQNQAESYIKKTEPTSAPVSFEPSTHERVRKINNISSKAAQVSSTTVGHIGKMAHSFGTNFGRKKDGSGRGYDANGNAIESYKPGMLNKSLIAFNTVADGIDYAAKNLLVGTSNSVTSIVDHRWGTEAGNVSRNVGSGFKNVALVYIDVTGVSRKAILKRVVKGMVVGKVAKGGGNIVVGGEDGNTLVPENPKLVYGNSSRTNSGNPSPRKKN